MSFSPPASFFLKKKNIIIIIALYIHFNVVVRFWVLTRERDREKNNNNKEARGFYKKQLALQLYMMITDNQPQRAYVSTFDLLVMWLFVL